MSAGAPGDGLPAATSVLAVCAHPDDESFGLGAVLTRFAVSGARVSMLCFTQGEASTLGLTDRPLGEVRREELAEAAAVLGVARVELLDYPDGGLPKVPLERLARNVATAADEVAADLLVVFDEGGITGHPDHVRATEAALEGAPLTPVLAWSLPREVADALNAEFGAGFVGRGADGVDLRLNVDRGIQRLAIACHASQATDNPVLRRRLELQGDAETLRWLRPPPATPSGDTAEARRRDVAAQWDPRYGAGGRVFTTEPSEALVELVSGLVPGRAVDLGAGEGRNSLWLARRGWRVVAVDASRVALDRLEAAAADEGLAVETVVADLTGYLDAEGLAGRRFDLALLAYVHPAPDERDALLETAARALAPGGHLLVVGHHRSALGRSGPPDPARLYTTDDLRRVVGVEVISLGERTGANDARDESTDVVLWARRPGEPTSAPAP
ncbi:MAG TPA: PIG-L family deacetylase [Acidimicrobiales bacterium]|nr:MAG: hypothetical protein B7Z69_02870 [Actinobacteria bacterium 21-73-9]HQU25500.1 PIG-L family deacetylase [Acidimicrobiales bacterium]